MPTACHAIGTVELPVRKTPTAAALLHGRHGNGTLDTVPAIDDAVKEALGPRVAYNLEPPKAELELPLEGAPGWRLGLVVLVHEGSLVIAEVKVFPGGDRLDPAVVSRHEWPTVLRQWSEEASALEGTEVPTITTRMLRSIRLGEIISAIRDDLESRRDLEPRVRNFWEDALGPSTLGEAFAEVLSHAPAHPRRGDIYLAELAQRYAERVAAGSKSPVKDLAVGVSTAHIRDAIFRAREKGYLTSSHGPRPGGVLTQAGREVLGRAAQEAQKVSSPKVVRRRGATAKSPFVQTEEDTK
jgi:hypothetical protein